MRSVAGGFGLVGPLVLLALTFATAHDSADAGVHAELVGDLAPAHAAVGRSVAIPHGRKLVDGLAGLVRPDDQPHRATDTVSAGEIGELSFVDGQAMCREAIRGMSDRGGVRRSFIGLVLPTRGGHGLSS